MSDLALSFRQWHFATSDNPVLSPEAVAQLYATYQMGSPEMAQELDAKLIEAGSGVAFPEWSDKLHVADYEPPKGEGIWTGGGDWGYAKPGLLYLIWTGPERSLVRLEYQFRETSPYEVGYQWALKTMRFPEASWFAVDEPAVSDGGPTILERMTAGFVDARLGRGAAASPEKIPAFVNPPKGPGSRAAKKMLLHEALKVRRATLLPDGSIPPWAMPALQFHPSCEAAIRSISRIPKDPLGKEDVDTNAFDHPYDAITGWLMARRPEMAPRAHIHRHPDEMGSEDFIRMASLEKTKAPLRLSWSRKVAANTGREHSFFRSGRR